MQLSAASLTTLLLLLVAAASASIAASGKNINLEDFKCKLQDTACLKKYLQDDVIARFSTGFPEFGVKPFDPLHFEDLSFEYKIAPRIKVLLQHINPILYGLSKTQVIDVRVQVSGDSFDLEARIYIPKLFYEGTYTFKGDCLLFPIDWSGAFNMSLGDVSSTWKLKADIVQKGKVSYLGLKDLSFGLELATFKTYASGLFWGCEEPSDLILDLTNKYWHGFFDILWKLAKPDAINIASDAISSILSKTPITGMTPTKLPSDPHPNLFN